MIDGSVIVLHLPSLVEIARFETDGSHSGERSRPVAVSVRTKPALLVVSVCACVRACVRDGQSCRLPYTRTRTPTRAHTYIHAHTLTLVTSPPLSLPLSFSRSLARSLSLSLSLTLPPSLSLSLSLPFFFLSFFLSLSLSLSLSLFPTHARAPNETSHGASLLCGPVRGQGEERSGKACVRHGAEAGAAVSALGRGR